MSEGTTILVIYVNHIVLIVELKKKKSKVFALKDLGSLKHFSWKLCCVVEGMDLFSLMLCLYGMFSVKMRMVSMEKPFFLVFCNDFLADYCFNKRMNNCWIYS